MKPARYMIATGRFGRNLTIHAYSPDLGAAVEYAERANTGRLTWQEYRVYRSVPMHVHGSPGWKRAGLPGRDGSGRKY